MEVELDDINRCDLCLFTGELCRRDEPCESWYDQSIKRREDMLQMNYVNIAKLCHKVNKEYCEAMGDASQVSWDEAPEWQKNSAIKGVEMHLTTEGVTPEDSHKAWMKQKIDEGWKYGTVKDPEKKEHPCILPYFELPYQQKAKDYIFKAICDFFKEEK